MYYHSKCFHHCLWSRTWLHHPPIHRSSYYHICQMARTSWNLRALALNCQMYCRPSRRMVGLWNHCTVTKNQYPPPCHPVGCQYYISVTESDQYSPLKWEVTSRLSSSQILAHSIKKWTTIHKTWLFMNYDTENIWICNQQEPMLLCILFAFNALQTDHQSIFTTFVLREREVENRMWISVKNWKMLKF